MNRTTAAFEWPESSRELDEWRQAGRTPNLFLRDDDAVSDTPALRRLFDLCRRHDVPLLLAAIPARADEGLASLVRREPLVTGAVHGYAHASYAPIGSKPCELGIDRPADDVIAELTKGRARLSKLFGRQLSALLVPPWNRIHPEIAQRIGEAGFMGISAHGWEPAAHGIVSVNCHVDLILWSGGRKGRTLEWLDVEIAQNLAIARVRPNAAVGILTHHLVHDESAWLGLETILQRFGDSNAEWVAADEMLNRTSAQA